MKYVPALIVCCSLAAAEVVPDSLIKSILTNVSTGNILRHAGSLASMSRNPNSSGFFKAADYVAAEAKKAGLQNVRIERFERRRPMWDAVSGELQLVKPSERTLASLATSPLLVMQRSQAGDVTGRLADSGAADVAGKIVLVRKVPGDSQWKQLKERGAVALLCAERLEFFGRQVPYDSVSWLTAPEGALAMAISAKQADELSALLTKGQSVELRMKATVAEPQPGAIGMVMGELPGTVPDQDIVIVAHLDHHKAGANDNASGSAVLLELVRLVRELETPLRRTVRFWWSTEITSERDYFRAHPEQSKKIRLAVNLDQAGGDRNAINNMIAIYGPESLPSWADDLIHNLMEDVLANYAPSEHAPSELLVAENGSRQPLSPQYWPYMPLSDHVAFEASEVGIPAISLAVPSLNVIHTDADTFDRLDPTWLKRSALFTLAPALFASNATEQDARALLDYSFRRAVARIAAASDRNRQLEIERQRMQSIRSLNDAVDPAAFVAKLEAVAAAIR